MTAPLAFNVFLQPGDLQKTDVRTMNAYIGSHMGEATLYADVEFSFRIES
ncbi:hypothetical protein GCM10009753_21550 [Streptantibioticus ferralitis]